MKRPLLLVALICVVVSYFFVQNNYKSMVFATRENIPSNLVLPQNSVVFQGRVVSYDLSKRAIIFKADAPADFQFRLRYKENSDFEKMLLGNSYHYKVTVDMNKNPFRSTKNFRVFDYDLYLFSNGILGQYDLIGFEAIDATRCMHCKNLELKSAYSKNLKTRFNQETYGFIQAVLLSDKADFEAYDSYKALGLAHLFAISGLHFGLIYKVLDKSLRFGSRSIMAIIKICILALFLLWIGQSFSALRAFWIICYKEIGDLLNKKIDTLTALAFSSLMILLPYPYAILSQSFQLSFFAYFMITVVYRSPKYKFKIFNGAHFALGIQLLLLPSSVFYFRSAYLFSFMTNFIFVPFIGILLPLVIMDAFLSIVSMSSLTETFLVYGVRGLNSLIDYFSFVPMPLKWFRHFDFVWIIFLCAVFLLASCFNVFSNNRKKITRAVSMLIVVYLCSQSAFSLPYEVHFVDVGDGDFSLIRAGNVSVLIDLGDGYTSVGEYLKYHDVHQLDAVILSHAHRDHIGGFDEIVKTHPIKNLYLNDETARVLEESLKEFDGQVIIVEGAVNLSWEDEKLNIDLMPTFSNTETNDRGVNAFVNIKGVKGYYLGDLHDFGIAQLQFKASFDFLKVPHHGSKTSVNNKLYTETEFKYGIISHGTKYRFPNTEVIDALDGLGASYYSTYFHGSVVMKLDKNNVAFKYYLQ